MNTGVNKTENTETKIILVRPTIEMKQKALEYRKEHFDIYLKEALENSKSTESIYSVAKLAARLRLEEEQKELKGYELEEFELHYDSKLENYTYEYEHELRSANVE